MKFKTVCEGQQAVVYNRDGEGRIVVGPAREFLGIGERLSYLDSHTANIFEYLVVKNIDGSVEHHPGPVRMYDNPLKYRSITISSGTQIDANHVLVVYKRMKDNTYQRKIIDGPTLFIPTAEEWCHEFKWHGADPNQKGRMIPNVNAFTQLPVVPDQFYYNVKEVRTLDDTLLTVKLMIFYELKDILKMLENTHDPIADMINGMCADIIAFAGRLSYSEFLTQTGSLCDLDSYPQLMQRTERVGYKVNKVVYIGYHASAQLQAMQDAAIESRTKMRLDAELEEQKEKLRAFRLQAEQARTKLRQDMQSSKQQHSLKVESIGQTFQIQQDAKQHNVQLELDNLTTTTNLELEKLKHEKHLKHLEDLRELGVNLDEYLKQQQPVPPTEEFRVVAH